MAVRTPAPSPVSLSHAQAPRCSMRRANVSASLTIYKGYRSLSFHVDVEKDEVETFLTLWLLFPSMATTKPTPQASCSFCGSYNPCLGGASHSITAKKYIEIFFRCLYTDLHSVKFV